ncbi:hypothetical protein NLU13_0449 [Sarocladium strictum]|uniref:Alkaline phosphatase n=1 Tax=Sarocladium strictum TaxID=5046 RepID=A0AA39LAT7_SARSR|nr:hypothetical protein NLU13_0449 [Sarocladium strictum]
MHSFFVLTQSQPVGLTRTQSANNLVTDSGAAGTALACGFKTNNGALGVLPNGQPVGSVLEAAKLNGFKTGLVVTSTINHATPAAYSAHSADRNAYAQIAAQQVGYSHPLGQAVDVLLGGGRCYFKPEGSSASCREDNIDLFAYAEKRGYHVAQNRSDFDALDLGRGNVRLPILGLFNDGDLSYEVDRKQQAEDVREPSLSEMTEVGLNALHRATHCKEKGFFMMIEASRIDHASHANDPAAHLWDVLEYNNVMDKVLKWIDAHPDTAMISVADHETGGITLPSRHDPSRLTSATQSIEYLTELWENYDGSDRRGYLTSDILPAYGLSDASGSDIDSILSGSFASRLSALLSSRAGIAWGTGGHTAVDTTLYAYAVGDMGEQLKLDVAGSFDNTELPWYVADALKVDMDEVTALLRGNGTDWVPT